MSTLTADIVIGPEMAGVSMSPEEFDSATEWNEFYTYELINGVLVVAPAPGVAERGPNELLSRWLGNYQEHHPQGSALDYTVTQQDVRVGENRRRADRVIWAGLGRLPDFDNDVPAIAIEFVSAGLRNWQRDYQLKRKEYHAAGISEYWVIDRFRRQMTVYRRVGSRSVKLTIDDDEVYTTSLLPGFELPVAKLFDEADRVASPQRKRRR